ncbi:MAG: hypothetical protein PHD81_02275 [Candidatus Nanoarchaeia archaeon]|nr:hypothetical protein [Candidatus Nanoarchaeia archaeon]MDD5587914.1 hypothetical protein [Candidatus Nanoarchaeia archaeon]
MKDINKMFIAMFMIVITILIVPASVYSVTDITVNPTFPTTTTSTLPQDERDMGEAIVVNVEQVEPTNGIIKSQWIEGGNFPVGVYLTGHTLGSLLMQGNSPSMEPFVGNPIIKNANVYPVGSESNNYLISAQYIAPEMSAKSVENLGYVILMLRQIKDETKIPNEINLNLSMRIYFDFTRGFGDVSSQDLILEESPEETVWKTTQADKNAFFNRKGYLRATLIEGNRAKIQVYGSNFGILSLGDASELERRGVVTMSPGETRVLSLPGVSSFFHDRFSLTLIKVSEPENTATLDTTVYGEKTQRVVAVGMKIYPGSDWTVTQIVGGNSCTYSADCESGYICDINKKCVIDPLKPKPTTPSDSCIDLAQPDCEKKSNCVWQQGECASKSSQQLVKIRNSFGDERTLDLFINKDKRDIGAITDPKTYEGEICTEVDVIPTSEGDLLKEQEGIKYLLDYSKEGNKNNEQTKKFYCTSINQYKKAADMAGSDSKYIYNANLMLGDAYISLADIVSWDKVNIARRLAEYYYGKAGSTSDVTNRITNIRNSINTNTQSSIVSIPEDGAYVSLVEVNSVLPSQKSTADLRIGGQTVTVYEGGEIEALGGKYNTSPIKNFRWIVYSIQGTRVLLKRESSSVSGTTTIWTPDQDLDIISGTISNTYTEYDANNAGIASSKKEISLIKINSKKRAYVSVSPGTGESYSTSNFQVHLSVNKRDIQWTPEQIDKMINQTNKQIEQLTKFITQLDNIIKTWKNICLVTFGLLVVKNALTFGAADRALARKEVMPYYNNQCKQEVLLSTGPKTISQCLSGKSKNIEESLDLVQERIKEKKDCSKKGNIDSCIQGMDIWKEHSETFTEADQLYKDSLLPTPVDKSLLLDYKECLQIESDTKLNSNLDILKEANKQKCDNLKISIDNKVNAYEKAKELTEKDFGNLIKFKNLSLEEKTQAANEFNTVYTMGLGAYAAQQQTKTSDPKVAENIQNEFTTAFKISSETKVLFLPYAIRTATSTANGNQDIKVTAFEQLEIDKDTGKLNDLKPTSLIPATLADLSNTDPTNQLLNQCKPKGATAEFTSSCLSTTDWKMSGYNVYKSTTENKIVIAGETTSFDSTGLNTKYAKNAKAEFDKDGKPYCIPTGEGGNYVKILSWYDYGNPQDCTYWNVGPDGMLCSGDDKIIVDKERINQDPRSMGKCENLATKFSKCTEGGILEGLTNPQTGTVFRCSQQSYKLAQQIADANCQDFMDPDDCKTLFAVCDPVMCPNSRFNLGGNYNVATSVVETGIIGSLVLGSTNYPETPLPICLPGISAGLKNIRSLLEGFVACLHKSRTDHENIGICDKIRSLGVCELLWKELINIFDMKGGIVTALSEKLFGKESGGSEYLSFETNMQTTSNMVNYFTKNYATSAFSAYNAMSTQEFGTKICKAAIFGKFADVGNLMDQLSEPENPPQFYGEFDETPVLTMAGNVPGSVVGTLGSVQQVSGYSVYYHIYAGTIPEAVRVGSAATGIQYAVYLVDPQGYYVPATSETSGVVYETIPYGDSADKTVNIVGKTGMNQICIVISGRKECGFGKVTTNYALNTLNDKLVESELARKITSQKQCTPDSPTLSTSSGSLVLPEEYGAISTGIIRTCSTVNPGSGTNPNDWRPIGTCGKDKTGNDLGSCWIDTRTIDIKNVKEQQDALANLEVAQLKVEQSSQNFKDIVGKLFDIKTSQNYFSLLETKLEEAKKSKTIDKSVDLINLLAGTPFTGQTKQITEVPTTTTEVGTTATTTTTNKDVSVNYRALSLYSMDTTSKIYSQIRVGEIYKMIGDLIKKGRDKSADCTAQGNTWNKEKELCETGSKTVGAGSENGETQPTETKIDCTKLFVEDVCVAAHCVWSSTGCNNPVKKTILSNTQTITINKGETQTAILKDFPEFFITLKNSNKDVISVDWPSDCGNLAGGKDIINKEESFTVVCNKFNKKVKLTVKDSNNNLAKIQVDYLGEAKKNCEEGCGYTLLGVTTSFTCNEEKCKSLFGGGVCYYSGLGVPLIGDRCTNCPTDCTSLKETYCTKCSSCAWYKDKCWKDEGWIWSFKDKSDTKLISVNDFSEICLETSINKLFIVPAGIREQKLADLLESASPLNDNNLNEKRLSIVLPLSIRQYEALPIDCKNGKWFLATEVPKKVPQ